MKTIDNAQIITLETTEDATQLHMIVEDCHVRLNFPLQPEPSAISDLKRIMLGDVTKS